MQDGADAAILGAVVVDLKVTLIMHVKIVVISILIIFDVLLELHSI